ncbi:MAG: hypothetical protein QXS20_01515 [Candidatus Thorarchaeota archaeon]
MSNSDAPGQSDSIGMGRWIAAGSELPCSVIIFVYLGDLIGASLYGPQGRNLGAMVGAIVGFLLGVFGVYSTIRFYENIERVSSRRRAWLPPIEEILEEPDLSRMTRDSPE